MFATQLILLNTYKMKQFLLTIMFVAACLVPSFAWAQGATTANISGSVTSATGETLPGANIIAVHEPTGTQYGNVSRADGRFNLPNVRTGGPYTITVSFIGYTTQQRRDVTLALGQDYTANFVLTEDTDQLAEVLVLATEDRTFNSGRTGASTNISREQIQNLPTLNRSLGDFTRLTPQANGNSFGGMNNRFNNITIDGAVNNDVFGLSGSGTPGGQAGTQPISLDAIQEIQVVLAPYDVTLGNFTGGGINAITRSGTNDVNGSVYYFGRNQRTIGNDVITDVPAAEFYDRQYGVRVGGPIIQNKLFFFLNADLARRGQPLAFNAGEPNAVITTAEAQELSNFLREEYGYDAGAFGPITALTESNKLFGRLDWNISGNHQLTLRHNFVDAFDDNISRSNNFFRFGNNAYQFNSKTSSTVAELKSQFSNRFSNKLLVGYSRIRDNRQTAGQLFPQVTISGYPGGGQVEFGSQRSSTANELDQDIFEFTNNFKIYQGNHTFTIGTHNEFFEFRNLFINNLYGRWDFNTVEDFYANRPARVQSTYSLDPNNPLPAAQFRASQLGFYVQDEYAVSRQLKLTAGLRVDIPIFPDVPGRNEAFEQAFPGRRTDETPSGQLLWAPRLGFNWDATGDRTIQVRGGTGVFTGRVPFVWFSNQFSNAGALFGTVDLRGNNIIGADGAGTFQPDPNQQGPTLGGGGAPTTYEINAIDNNFKIPQVWRTNLATDFMLPAGIVATVEGIYTKTLNNILYQDINLVDQDGTLDPALSGGADTRPVYPIARRRDNTFTNAIFLTNTNEGYSYNLTGQLRKDFRGGFTSMIAYTYGKAMDVNSGTSSTARSNWEFNQIVGNPNNPPLAYSNFDLRHRIVGNLGYRVEYANNFATTVSLFYAGRSGSPFTYLYFGDVNRDGARNNDLMYVPRDASEINLVQATFGGTVYTPEEQWAALNNFIENDAYLSTRRGQYTERNGARTPWEHQFDLRLMQDLFVDVAGKRNTLQLTLDIFNVGNLLNNDWGRNYFVGNQAVTLVNFRDAANARDGFTFNPNTRQDPWAISNFASRWQGQVGVRYIFGN
jgi:hypothetical protein